MQDATNMGPLVREADAARVESWVHEAVDGGARVVSGGTRDGAIMTPTILVDVDPDMRVSREEVFGPTVAVTPAADIDEAINLANDTNFGLAAAIFTQNVDHAMRFALEAEAGNLNINSGTQFRADMMPYGGLKDSGFGKEGPALRHRRDDRVEDGGFPLEHRIALVNGQHLDQTVRASLNIGYVARSAESSIGKQLA